MIELKHYKDLPRCPIPVIFLDTPIISNIAKWKIGRDLDKTTSHRVKTLYELVSQLVRAKRLLCPEISTYQDEYRLDTSIDQVCEQIVVDLSKGIRFVHPQGVENLQIQLAMNSYLQNAGSVDCGKEWLYVYNDDPIQKLLSDTHFIYRFNWLRNIEDNERIRERKKS